MEKKQYNPVEEAYKLLESLMNQKSEAVTIEEAMIAIEEAVGYLGEALDDHTAEVANETQLR